MFRKPKHSVQKCVYTLFFCLSDISPLVQINMCILWWWWWFSCSSGLGSWESDDDADMDDEDSVVTALGCLGPLGGLLAPELQRYQKHLKGQRTHTHGI